MPQLGATFVPGGLDDYSLPEVVSPSPRRVTPQISQNMQNELQVLDLDDEQSSKVTGTPPANMDPGAERAPAPSASRSRPADDAGQRNRQNNDPPAPRLDMMDRGAPSFSTFPKITGDNVPPADEAKEEILWNARRHVLHSQNVSMQISWARDALTWVDIAADAATREPANKSRSSTPRVEHELREDAVNIINYLARQEHPDALYIRSKWHEFGKFGHRVDKREAYTGYKRAAELSHARSEYRLGMLFEQSNDMAKAKEHYYRGMSMQDSAALYRMGMMSLLGQYGESKDFPRGLERIQAAADSADEDAPQGSYVYGMLVGRDLPDIAIPDGLLPFNLETAKMYVEKAAYLGFSKAQLKMGQAYELCQLGCEFHPSHSLHYYGLAAKQGLPEAALGVSRWFLFGYEGVFKKNEELAFKYAQEAATAKLPTGEFAMGYYYEIGIHVNKSISEARRWYQLAAEHGNKDATGRLDSLSQDKSLSKQDHETTTLTRIKSQHGSQRGKRPERLNKQPQHMPTLSESGRAPTPVDDGSGHFRKPPVKSSSATASPRVSPQPSPGIKPTIVSENTSFPDPSRASLMTTGQGLARIAQDPPLPIQRTRPKARQFHTAWACIRPWTARPIDRAGSLQPLATPPPRGRVASAGYNHPGLGAHRQPSPGPFPVAGRLYPADDGRNGLESNLHAYSSGSQTGNRMQKPATRPALSRPGAETPPFHDPRAPAQNQERPSRVPGVIGRPERLGSLPPQEAQRPSRVASGPGQGLSNSPKPGVGRTGSAPPSAQGSTTAPSKPSKGPATFEDMGIPQGKQEGDCVVM
ncbi:hypothetical protein CDD83_9753 [Cordyceps sp. RAO-2017]|nr:hypothetical protein CDD83_9753 [Cordyceps sp. RAO-2017]